MTPRLTTAVLVSALLRRVANAGGAAVVVARGDATAGAILLSCLERGEPTGYFERVLTDRGYRWLPVGPASPPASLKPASLMPASSLPASSMPDSPMPGSLTTTEWLDRRRSRDPDLWIVELDIANAQRFAAETSGDG